MKLSKWIKKSTFEELKKLAKRVDCHPRYLYQVGTKGCSAGLAKKIERCTEKLTPGRVVKKNELRPDIWSKKDIQGS